MLFICSLFMFTVVFCSAINNVEDINVINRGIGATDPHVWLVEFYSPMCGSCQEFAETWHTLTATMKTIVSAKVNIDTEAGSALASSMGVFDEGVPNMRLIKDSSDSNGSTLLKGDLASLSELRRMIKREVEGLRKGDDGMYIKS